MRRVVGLASVLGIVALLLWLLGEPPRPDAGVPNTAAPAATEPNEPPPVRGRAPSAEDGEDPETDEAEAGDPGAAGLSPEHPDAVAERGTVRGRVVDAEGRPIADAQVWLAPAHVIFWFTDGQDGVSDYQHIRFRAPRTVTDGDGRYEFREVGMGASYKLNCSAKGFGDARAGVHVENEEPVEAPDVTLPRAASLTITVVGPDGNTVPQADVAVDTWLGLTRKMVPGGGIHRFENLQPRKWGVLVTSPPFLVARRDVELAPGEQGALTVHLERGGVTLAGVVEYASGLPAPRVTVRAREFSRYLMSGSFDKGDDASQHLSEGRALTGPQGRFRIEGLRRGLHTIEVVKDDSVLLKRRQVAVPSDELRLTMPGGDVLRGRVLLPPGVPVPKEVTVTLHEPRRHMWPTLLGRWTVTWDEGRFSLPILPDEVKHLIFGVRLEGCAPFGREFDSPGDSPFDLGELRPARGLVLEGRVVDAEGEPIAEASVHSAGSTVHTLATGSFRLPDQPAGAIRADVNAPGYVQGQHHCTVGDGPIEVVLRREAVLRGRALNADGKPVPEANVGIFYVDDKGKTHWYGDCYADHRGVFQRAIPPGRIRIGTYDDCRMRREPKGPDLELAPGERTWLILKR